MSEKKPFPPIDHFAIQFPSDNVTLGQARRIDLDLEAGSVFGSSDSLGDALAINIIPLITLSNEMELAERAYAKALGQPDPWRGSRAELLSNLRRDWKACGISSGPQQSAQFIRDIEKAARMQAERHLGKGV